MVDTSKLKGHTPGPWRVEMWKYADGQEVIPTIQNDSDAVAQICGIYRTMQSAAELDAERQANSLLIAAAPDLLADRASLESLLAERMAEVRRLREALETVRRTFAKDCMFCHKTTRYSGHDEIVNHKEECPAAIARKALEGGSQ